MNTHRTIFGCWRGTAWALTLTAGTASWTTSVFEVKEFQNYTWNENIGEWKKIQNISENIWRVMKVIFRQAYQQLNYGFSTTKSIHKIIPRKKKIENYQYHNHSERDFFQIDSSSFSAPLHDAGWRHRCWNRHEPVRAAVRAAAGDFVSHGYGAIRHMHTLNIIPTQVMFAFYSSFTFFWWFFSSLVLGIAPEDQYLCKTGFRELQQIRTQTSGTATLFDLDIFDSALLTVERQPPPPPVCCVDCYFYIV